MRKNEHPRCGCSSCRRGASTAAGKYVHRAVNRRLRHVTKQVLRLLPEYDEFVSVIVSTPYTD